MKILLTSDWYLSAANGVATSVSNLRKGLEERGHEVRLLTLAAGHYSYEEAGVTYIGSVSAEAVYPGARIRLLSGKSLIKALMEWKPDILHSNCEFSTFHYARKISRDLNIPIVHTCHTVYENYSHYIMPGRKMGKKAADKLYRWVGKKADCLIAPTEKMADILRDCGVAAPVYVAPTGIDREAFMQEKSRIKGRIIRKEMKIPEEYTVLIFLGRLGKEKNCEELLRAFIRAKKEKTILIFAGDGPCRQELERQVKILKGEDRVRFTGLIPREETAVYYRAADLFVSASSSEAQGLTYLEALASGLPLLCREDSCLRNVLLNGVNGWQYSSEEEFRRRLNQFTESPSLRKKLQAKAVETGKEFSIETFAKNIDEIYQKEKCRLSDMKHMGTLL